MNSTAPAPGGAFSLDPQLARDTVAVGDLPLARVLLMNDANFPWLIAGAAARRAPSRSSTSTTASGRN